MKTMSHKIWLCALTAGLISCQTKAQILYDIDFSSPRHTAGSAPSVDLGSAPRSGPSRNNFNAPVIVESFGSLTNGAAHFRSVDNRLSQIELAVESPFQGLGVDESRYVLEFDLIVEHMGGAFDSFTILFDGPSVSTFIFRGDGLIQVGRSTDFIGSFDFGDRQSVRVLADIDSQWWSITVNGAELFAGAMQNDPVELRAIRLSTDDRNGFDTRVYVDNIVVTPVPAPSVAAIAIPLVPVICRRRRSGFEPNRHERSLRE